MKRFVIYETKILDKEITDYRPINKLMPSLVKVNGKDIKAIVSGSIGDITISFDDPIRVGSTLTVVFDSDSDKVFTRRLIPINEIISLYSSDVKLANNTEYNYSLKLKFENEPFNNTYRTRYSPYYTTIKTIRNDTGGLLDLVDDSVIDQIIFENSLTVEEILGDKLSDYVDGSTVKLPVSNYVRYKTDIDIVYAVYLKMCGRFGKFDKLIGTMEISNDYKLPELEDMLSRFKELLKMYEDMFAGVDTPVSFRKANGTEYTVAQRGIF